MRTCFLPPTTHGLRVRLVELALTQHYVVSTSQALGLGMNKHALHRATKAGTLERILPEVYRLARSPRSWEGDLMAAHLWLRPISAVSHTSACAVWRLPGFDPGNVELSTPRRKRSLSPVVVHLVGADLAAHTTTVGCIPVTNAGRSLVDASGSMCDADDLEAAVEDAIRRRLTSRRHLLWLIDGRKGKAAKGLGVLRRLLINRTQPVTESHLETRLLQAIRRARLPLPATQYEVRDGDRFVARVGFAYPCAKVAIEADSYWYHSGQQAWDSDIDRRNDLTALGWLVIHVTYRQMTGDIEKVVKRIQRALTPSLTVEANIPVRRRGSASDA